MSGAGASARARLESMSVGIIDAGVAIAWIRGGTRIHPPDEAIARRGARLETSRLDGFAAATVQEPGVRFHTTDDELVRQLRRVRLAITHY
jgi:hypothetical protein